MNVLASVCGLTLIAIALLLMFFDERIVGPWVPSWYMLVTITALVAGILCLSAVFPPTPYL